MSLNNPPSVLFKIAARTGLFWMFSKMIIVMIKCHIKHCPVLAAL